MNRAPTSELGASLGCCSRLSVGASAPVGAPALMYVSTATDRPTTTTECRQVVGDTLMPTYRQK